MNLNNYVSGFRIDWLIMGTKKNFYFSSVWPLKCRYAVPKKSKDVVRYILYLISPYPNRLVLSSTANLLPIRTPIYCKNFVLVAGQVHRKFASADIPHLQRCIL